MSIQPEKYVRKPLIVLGVQVTNENFMELALWVQGSIFNIDGTQGGPIDPNKQYILVRVHNPKSPRQSKAIVGDWILYSDRGYKVYTPKAFNNTFDRLTKDGAEREEPNPEATRAKAFNNTFDRLIKDEETVDEYIDKMEKDEVSYDKYLDVKEKDEDRHEERAKALRVEMEDSDYDE